MCSIVLMCFRLFILLSGDICTMYMRRDLFSAMDFFVENFLTDMNFRFSIFFFS